MICEELTGRKLGNYTIEATLGRGGMGVVYRAVDNRLGRAVALKVLPPDFAEDPQRRGRFEREARAAAAVSHPNIAAVYDVGEVDGRAFLAMELIEGESLRQRIARGPLSFERALSIASGVARGLARAHEKGVIHRDLKPDNVMLTDEGEAKILDFGLARQVTTPTGFDATAVAEAVTVTGQVMGTPGYMSPEQAAGRPVDARTDIFSFGILLYELTCGQRPFTGASTMEVMIAIARDEPLAPSALNPDMPTDLERLITICLKKRPDDRYSTTRDLVRDLERVAAPSSSRPPAPSKRLQSERAPAASPSSSGQRARVTTSPPELSLPDKPSIAVMPFQNLSGDPEQDYFADGVVEDIITALSRSRWLFVIARNSTFAYKGKGVESKKVGRELGVRYILEGSVRKAGSRMRITGQLIEAESGAHIWADRCDGALEDVFDLQDKITESVVGAIEPSLRQAEVARARRKRPESLDAYDLVLRALPHVSSHEVSEQELAMPLLEKAISLDPCYAAAHAYASWCIEHRYIRTGFRREDREAALLHARAALAHGADDPTALALAGFVIGYIESDHQAALSALDQALTLNPSSAQAYGLSATIRVFAGEFERGRELAERALRLSPLDPMRSTPYIALSLAHFYTNRFADSASAAAKAIQASPGFAAAHAVLIAARVRLGQMEEARAAATRLLQVVPSFTAGDHERAFTGATSRPDWAAMLGDALREAGVPNGEERSIGCS